MTILTIVIYFFGTLLALVLLFTLFFLLVPFGYRARAGYSNHPWLNFSIRCSPAFILAGSWSLQHGDSFKVNFILFGIPLSIDPKKTVKKEKKKHKKKGFKAGAFIMDKDLRVRGIIFLKDLLRILKPDHFSLEGKIGFDEPHLTGWLAAFTAILENCCNHTFVDLEPVWEDEQYEFEALIKGSLSAGLILAKTGWFFLSIRTRNLFKRKGNDLAATR